METITTKEKLIAELKDVLALEVMVRDRYKGDIDAFSKPQIVDKIKEIELDEEEHVRIINEFIKAQE